MTIWKILLNVFLPCCDDKVDVVPNMAFAVAELQFHAIKMNKK
jgi:hypothetical protein